MAAIDTIGQYMNSPALSKTCKESFMDFQKHDPKEKYAYAYVLHENITYNIKPYGKECFVMLNGGTSWSEYLIEKGYALLSKSISPDYINSVGYEKLTLAQNRAKYHKRGIWSDIIVAQCLESVQK